MVFRRSSAEAEALSAYLRGGDDAPIARRRTISRLYLGGMTAFSVVAAYQMGLIKRVPEPRLPFLDADRVDASGEAYASLRMPDAILGLISYGITLALVTKGDAEDRMSRGSWLPLVTLLKVALDSGSGAILTAEQIVKHKALCSWCLGAAAASWLSLPTAWRDMCSATLRRGAGDK